jgi:bacterioferritin
MTEQAVKILKLDVPKLVKLLNIALAEEWLAYYQYWIGARLMEGPMRSEVEPELLKHADEELGHAVLLADRIIQLDATPLIDPQEWFTHAQCKYAPPADIYIGAILKQNLDSERCAINRYQEIASITDGTDYATHQIAVSILKEELEHEKDIHDYLRDLKVMKERFMASCDCEKK